MATVNDLISGFTKKAQPASQGNESTSKPEKTQFWINVGIERAGKLVSLPMGIPLDKLEARKIPGSSTKNVEFRQLRQAEADLFSKVQQVMAAMKPGETYKLPFTVEIRRCEEAEVTTEQDVNENPFAVGPLTIKNDDAPAT